MNFQDFDFSTLQDIPSLQRYYETPRVSVTENGLFSINSALRKEVGAQREFRVKISPDCRHLALCLSQTPNVRFSAKGGNVIHRNLAQLLASHGLQLPAIYTMRWCPEQQAWIGCCQELPSPPPLSALANTAKKPATRKNAGR